MSLRIVVGTSGGRGGKYGPVALVVGDCLRQRCAHLRKVVVEGGVLPRAMSQPWISVSRNSCFEYSVTLTGPDEI